MKISSYIQHNTDSMQEGILKSLSEFKKELWRNLAKVEVRGKRGRKIPILFTPNTKDSVVLLIKTRKDVGISPENPNIFARPYFNSVVRIQGCDTIHKFAQSCGQTSTKPNRGSTLQPYRNS